MLVVEDDALNQMVTRKMLNSLGCDVEVVEDGRLVDGVSSYGFGITVFVLGVPLHWDWVQLWDFKNRINDRQVEFWMGVRF